MKTVTAETKAWITTNSPLSPEDLQSKNCINALSYSNLDMKSAGWTYAGKATITVEIVDVKELVSNKVDSLREELKEVKARAYAHQMRIESQINDLLAIAYEPVEA